MENNIDKKQFKHKTNRPIVLASVMLAMFMGAIEGTIVSTAMPAIVAELGDFSLYSWVFSSYLLMNTVTVLIYGKPDIEMAVTGIPVDSYNILLVHEPDLADAAHPFNIQLQISGHSHGGQVKIPFVGPLITPPYSEKYYEGFYELGNDDQTLTLYVNRGLGTTRLPFRFLSKPELTMFTLTAQNG